MRGKNNMIDNNKYLLFFLVFPIFLALLTNAYAGEWNYYLHDHLGNTRVVLDEQGDVKEYYDYYPFGKIMPGRSLVSGEQPATFKYTGKELDDENELNWYNFGARPYDPEIGRWPKKDLLDQYHSPYIYCGNNPINIIDILGLIGEEDDPYQAPTLYCIADRWSFWDDFRVGGWFSDYDASQGSSRNSEYSGAGEYTQQALNVWQNQGFWGLRTWQQQNDPNWRLVNRTIQTAAWLSVGGVGLAATGAYGIPAAIADLNAKITAGLGSLYTQTGQYIVAKYVAYSTTAGYGVKYYSAQAIAYGARYGQEIATRGQRIYYTALYRVMVNSKYAYEIGLGFSAGKSYVDYTPQTTIGWGAYGIGMISPWP
ncbi:hypothetical protein GF337_13675 [candidate division KSB1 bacterium]|nr:hypothetical protein [candidate division KSB1 bacterium]